MKNLYYYFIEKIIWSFFKKISFNFEGINFKQFILSIIILILNIFKKLAKKINFLDTVLNFFRSHNKFLSLFLKTKKLMLKNLILKISIKYFQKFFHFLNYIMLH